MPRYFFHVIDGQKFVDPTGIDFDSDATARALAKAYAKTISPFHRDREKVVKVTDAQGAEVICVPLHGQKKFAVVATPRHLARHAQLLGPVLDLPLPAH
jgi:hypothetical protein